MLKNVTCPHCGNKGNTEGKGFDIPPGWIGSNDEKFITLVCNRCGRITFFHDKLSSKNRSGKVTNYRGKKNEIWHTYIHMKRNNDKRLSEFLSHEYNKEVIAKKDFDVFQTKNSKMYHRRSCGYLSRSRTLKRMSRSDAIISGGVKCNSCMKEFNSSACIIAFIIVAIITIFGLLTGGIYF